MIFFLFPREYIHQYIFCIFRESNIFFCLFAIHKFRSSKPWKERWREKVNINKRPHILFCFVFISKIKYYIFMYLIRYGKAAEGGTNKRFGKCTNHCVNTGARATKIFFTSRSKPKNWAGSRLLYPNIVLYTTWEGY